MTIERLELLKRVNTMIVRLRRALGHDHGDNAWWTASGFTAPEAQRWRRRLAGVADALHVERATARGRVHSTRFAGIEEQRRWLDENARWRERAEEFVGEVGWPSLP
jgi:hypothetical protein